MARPIHRDQARTFLWGLVVLAVIAGIGYIGIRIQGGGSVPGKKYTYLTAVFSDVGMLKPLSEVTRGGVQVGSVASTRYTAEGAVVTMRLDGDIPVYRDARAAISNRSALGRKTVALEMGTSAAGRLGDQAIPLSQTAPSAALDDVFAAFDTETRTQLHSALVTTGSGLIGHSKDLNDLVRVAPELLDDASEVFQVVSDPKTDVAGLLKDADRLVGRFQGRSEMLRSLVKNLDTTLDAVGTDQGRPLVRTLERAPSALRNAEAGLTALQAPLADVRMTMRQLDGGVRGLVEAEADLRGFLRESRKPLDRLPALSPQATAAVQTLTGLLNQASPLVPKVTKALGSTSTLLNGLSPYAIDIGNLAAANTMLSGRLRKHEHYFSAMLVFPGLYTASLPDPVAVRIPYPTPGGGALADNPWRNR